MLNSVTLLNKKRMRHFSNLKYFLLTFVLIPFILIAKDDEIENGKDEKKEQSSNQKSKIDYKEELSETTHEVIIDGQPLSYKAIAGNLILHDEKEKPKASIFFVSYTKETKENEANRPITFCFNGGPGSSSVWLHLGVFGPKRVCLTEYGDALPPYHLIDNEFSILDVTDLVFIDPISTGFSHAIPIEDAKKYHGVEEDIKSIAEFIRLYLSRYNRWDSPKFLAGESYGTTRAAGLAGYLHDNYFTYVNGLVLVSSVLNFQSIRFDSGNDLSYMMFLPTYTATAWYHHKLEPELQNNFQKAIEECKDFVSNEYCLALFKGDLLEFEEKEKIVGKLARFTGLSKEYIARSNMRIKMMNFAKELLRDEGKTIGRFDSRFMGMDANQIGEQFEYDPSAEAVFGVFTATLNQYIRKNLEWKKDVDYKIIANIDSWDFSVATNQYLNVAETLRSVMTRNPHIRVFVANGFYDLATPFFATEYTFDHLGLPSNFRKHVSMKYYKAGHMMYIYRPALIQMKKDLAKYYLDTLTEQNELDDCHG